MGCKKDGKITKNEKGDGERKRIERGQKE